MERSPCVRVPRRSAEEARRLLRDAINTRLRPKRVGGEILFPVIVSPEEAAGALASHGIPAEPCEDAFEERPARPRPLSGPVRGYTRIGDIALFSQARGAGLEHYLQAAEELVRQGLARAVYLKTETAGRERVARLVHLAGEERTLTVAREYGLEIAVDIARVYYNPRLSEERRRVAAKIGDAWRVLDMFAGVGPFSLHIASLRQARVLAVDINPWAVRLMAENIARNRRRLRGCVTPVWADSRLLPEFVRPGFDAIIMNSPTMTPEFLPVACRLARAGAILFYYRVSRSCEEAWLEARESSPCGLRVEECVRVLDYSPARTVHRLTLRVEVESCAGPDRG